MALGGEAGARLATRLAIPISPDTLLRLASTRSRAETGQSAPRVLGVDDWAWRRGHRYGTILVDLERNEPIDLLPDRSAGAVANWLKRNPGVEIVARDRASVYSEGARQGAPDALQVADRWHVLRNLSEAVRSALERSHVVIQRVARAMAMDHAPRKVSDIAAPLPVLMPPSQAKQGSSRRGICSMKPVVYMLSGCPSAGSPDWWDPTARHSAVGSAPGRSHRGGSHDAAA